MSKRLRSKYSFGISEVFDKDGNLTDKERTWLEKQIIMVLGVAAMTLDIYLDGPEIAVENIIGHPLFATSRGWSVYGNHLEFTLTDMDIAKLPVALFEKVVDIAEHQFGYVATPRFNKFRVKLFYNQ